MDPASLRSVQQPLKDSYRDDPGRAVVTLRASGTIGEGVSCTVDTGRALAGAGLHSATGGDGSQLCSGDTLLEALVGCAGVTMAEVATSMGLDLRSVRVHAEGEIDFRGTLGVDKEAPVGFRDIRLRFDVDSDEDPQVLEKLGELTERYCVVLQTLRTSPAVATTLG